MIVEFSPETMETGRKWHGIFQLPKRKNYQPRFLYMPKISFKNQSETYDSLIKWAIKNEQRI